MDGLVPILMIGILTIGIYKLFELFVRRKERMAIIEKLSDNFDPELLGNKLSLPLFESNNASWPIRIGMLLLGVGLGVTVAVVVDLSTENIRQSYDAIRALYPASASIFGGLGLVIAYFIERKNQ